MEHPLRKWKEILKPTSLSLVYTDNPCKSQCELHTQTGGRINSEILGEDYQNVYAHVCTKANKQAQYEPWEHSITIYKMNIVSYGPLEEDSKGENSTTINLFLNNMALVGKGS